MSGARTAHDQLQTDALTTNNAYQYAVARNLLYEQSKTVELLVSYEPNMHTLSKWWQQLFGESEGKNNQGIYPAFVNFPTDLHAIDRKSTRLNSSHVAISYAVFCLKKKK